ncbi:AAA family ATPase [Myroides sp. LJL116]
MIPIKLTLQGIYSYQDAQVIDFTELTQSGLFGIFGKVGSGKSSIIEAITFGLYGESERLNARDNRAYNMMNLRSNHSVIEFDFYNFNDQKYRIYRSFKRNAKRFEDVKRVEAILYKWEEDSWVPQPSLDIAQVIGLSYENFKRTIIIPQGKFKEFIELGGKDRTKMMQEIFGLDRFDLSAKVKKMYVESKSQYDTLSGELSGYTSITPQLIKEKEVLVKQEDLLVEKLTKEYTTQHNIYQHLKAIQSDIVELEKNLESMVELEKQQPSISKQKKDLVLFEDLSSDFGLLLSQVELESSSFEQKNAALKQATDTSVQIKEKSSKIEQQLSIASKEFEKVDLLKQELFELDLIQKISSSLEQKNSLLTRMENGKGQINQAKVELQGLRELYSKQLSTLELRKKSLIDASVLLEMENWFTSFKHTRDRKPELLNKISNLDTQVKGIDIELAELQINPALMDWKQVLEAQKNQIEIQLKSKQDQLAHVKVAQKLQMYANELSDGSPCPLCGSLEHPSILDSSNKDIFAQGQHIELEISQLQEQSALLMEKQSKIQALLSKRELVLQTVKQEKSSLLEIDKELERLQKGYLWNTICPSDVDSFVALKHKSSKEQQEILALEAKLKELLSQGEKAKETVDRFVELLTKIEVSYTQVSSEINSKKEQLSTLKVEDFAEYSSLRLEELLKSKSDKIEQVNKTFNELTLESKNISMELTAINTQVESLQKDVQALESRLNQYNQELTQKLEKNHLENISQVKEVLSWKLDVKALREGIQQFELTIQVLKDRIEALKKKMPKDQFDLQAFLQMEKQVLELDSNLKDKVAYVTILKAEKTRLEQQYAVKIQLVDKFEALGSRIKNIQVLDNMFKGAGFVNYVSSIYLKNLCNMANVRFHRLTNNQLSLQLNEANDFEIIDYLNDGKPRSVKTLSGGQVFQVSLSLALALAESVQSLSKSNKNFFFIDEGFGTQDSESVQTVFETLQNLQKENRIVGIISHVDELQDLIPVSLTVRKDEQGVSTIIKEN